MIAALRPPAAPHRARTSPPSQDDARRADLRRLRGRDAARSIRPTVRARRRFCCSTSSRISTSHRWTRSAPSASISRPRRRSSPMTPATASWPTPITPRGSITCCRWRRHERLAALIDPDRAMPVADRRCPRQVHRETVYITRGRPRPHGGVADLLDLPRLRLGPRLRAVRHPLPEPRRGLHRSCQGTRTRRGRGKRPMHTIIPGHAAPSPMARPMPFGVMGGQYQSAGHARFVTNLRDFGLDLQTALDAPRSFAEDGRAPARARLRSGASRGRWPKRATMSQRLRPPSAARRRSASGPTACSKARRTPARTAARSATDPARRGRCPRTPGIFPVKKKGRRGASVAVFGEDPVEVAVPVAAILGEQLVRGHLAGLDAVLAAR